jgi:hypothetical protein
MTDEPHLRAQVQKIAFHLPEHTTTRAMIAME